MAEPAVRLVGGHDLFPAFNRNGHYPVSYLAGLRRHGVDTHGGVTSLRAARPERDGYLEAGRSMNSITSRMISYGPKAATIRPCWAGKDGDADPTPEARGDLTPLPGLRAVTLVVTDCFALSVRTGCRCGHLPAAPSAAP
jgi:hypothetical protein